MHNALHFTAVKQYVRTFAFLSDFYGAVSRCPGNARLGQAQLAEAAGILRMTIIDFEKGTRVPHPNNVAAIRTALEAAGVEFTDGDAPGVKLMGRPDAEV